MRRRDIYPDPALFCRFPEWRQAVSNAYAARTVITTLEPCETLVKAAHSRYTTDQHIVRGTIRASALRRPTMAVPKRKVSRMKRDNRRAHDSLTKPTYVEDKDTGELRRPHHIDLKTGMYRGRQVIEPKDEY